METTTAVRTPLVRSLWKVWGTAILVAAVVGCQKPPEPGAEKSGPPVEPKQERPAAAAVRQAHDGGVLSVSKGAAERDYARAEHLRLPGTIVAVDLRAPGELLKAAAEVVDALEPGVGAMMKATIPATAGFRDFEEVTSALGKRPATVLVLNPKAHRTPLVLVVGTDGREGVPALAEALARARGLQIAERDGVYLIAEAGKLGFVKRFEGWIVFGGSRELLDATVEAMRRGALPRAPAGGDDACIHVDLAEVRRAYRAEIEQRLMAARGMLGANPAVAENAMLGRFVQEYVTALGEIVRGFEEAEISLELSPEAVVVTQRVKPAAGTVFEPLAERPAGAKWTVASVLPADSPLALCARLDGEALGLLTEAFAEGITRVAGDQEGAVEVNELLRTSMEAMSGGESAFAITGYSGLGPSTVGAVTVDFRTYRRLQKETVGLMSLFGGLFETFGFKMKMNYEEDVGRLEGRPVDRVVTTIEATGPGAPALEAALSRFGGGKVSVTEYVGTPEGVVVANGADPRVTLRDALGRRRERGTSGAAGWPTAELRKFLENAPPRTWAAGEMRLGAYIAMVLGAVKQALPVAIDASALTGDDPPVVFWVAADGGRIVTRARVPVASVKNLVAFFAKFALSAGGAQAPDADFDFDFEKEGEVW